jgi:subtilisin family serine protease
MTCVRTSEQGACVAYADCEGHGTHVAGVVGGLAYGVAKDTALRAVRILDCEGNGAGELRQGVGHSWSWPWAAWGDSADGTRMKTSLHRS